MVTAASEHESPSVGPLRVPPALDSVNTPFWSGGGDGLLLITRCASCSRWSHPPRERCRYCHSTEVTPQPVSGRGTIVAATVNHQQWNPAGHVEPYVVALVELDEQPGLRLLTNVVGCPAQQASIGARVRVRFEPLDDVWLPLFELDPA